MLLHHRKPAASFSDELINQFDRALRTLTPGTQVANRPSPAHNLADTPLQPAARRHAAGLMRVNHSGEVCAQALYQGQALTAKHPRTQRKMAQAAAEEIDHLAWCEERLQQLDSRASLLNPAWYALSFGLGAAAGLISDKVSLGFVAATEDQVCEHLQDHLQVLPKEDAKSRAVVSEMMVDEKAHGNTALLAGGMVFPRPVKQMMRTVSRVMTGLSYRL